MNRQIAAEALGTAFLLATVVGSGIMAERLAGGNVAIALLGNTIPTGAILFVLITILAPYPGLISTQRSPSPSGSVAKSRTLWRSGMWLRKSAARSWAFGRRI